jgi:hypothetical protein
MVLAGIEEKPTTFRIVTGSDFSRWVEQQIGDA